MTQINVDRQIGFFAPARWGKTNGIANFVSSIPAPIIIYDTNHEWENQPNLKFIVNKKGNAIIFKPDYQREGDIEYLNQFIKIIREKRSNIWIYIEDIEKFYNDETRGKSGFYGEIKELSERGGHQRIGLIYSAKQFKYIPKSLISNTNLFYIGSFVEGRDISIANGMLKPEFDSSDLHKPQFVKLDRWSGEKSIVTFNKIF